MNLCIKCGGVVPETSKSVKYCSYRCSVLYLKAQYKKRHPERVRAWKETYLGAKGKYLTKDVRDEVLARFQNKCVRCESSVDLHVHHWKPMSWGGKHEKNNLVVFCRGCHHKIHKQFKSDFWKVE